MKFLKITFLILITVFLFPFSLIITPLILIIPKLFNDATDYSPVVNKTSFANYDEEIVSYYLNNLDKDVYTVIDNLTIPSNGNTTHTQIDHVVVSRYGIFCIETKSHKGWVFGSDKQKNWTQVLYKDHYQFYSPVKQNYAHVQALKSLLGSSLKYPIIPIVVFTNADKIKVDGDCNVGDICYMIEKIEKSSSPIYDYDECDRIVNSINYANQTDYDTYNRHCAEVQNIIASSRYS